MKKVECLMQGIGVVLKTQRAPSPDIDNNPKIPRVEIICRWLVYLFARCSFVAAEIECWYMMELLPKQVLEQVQLFFMFYFSSLRFSVLFVRTLTEKHYKIR